MTSLRDIVNQLKENQETQSSDMAELNISVEKMSEDLVSAISKTNNTIGSAILSEERNKLREREEKIEEGKKISRGGGRDQSSGVMSSVFGPALSGLGALSMRMLAPILTPLQAILRFLRVGGPVAIAIGLIYEVFRDIGENETFQNALVSIKETWNERIIPAFNRIKEIVQNLFQSEEFSNTLMNIRDKWNEIRDVIQDFAINTVSVVVDSIAGVVEGIAMMMEGDFLGGFTRISNSILEGIAGLADNVITSVLRLFGVDFGENGSFRTWLDEKLISLGEDVKALWDSFINSISTKWNNTITFFTETLPAKIETFGDDVKNVWDTFVNAISTKWNNTITFLTETLPEALSLGWEATKDLIMATFSYAATRIRNGLLESFELLKTTVLNIPDQIRLAIMENLRFGMPTIELPMPRWAQALGAPENFTLLSGFEVGVGNAEQIQEVRGRINEREESAVAAISGYRSETAASLEELNAAREAFRNTMVTPVVVNNVDNSSVTSGNATIRYDNRMSPYDTDMYLRRGLVPAEIM